MTRSRAIVKSYDFSCCGGCYILTFLFDDEYNERALDIG